MSFSDMMSSGRGPGVIGMVMALFVLVGFGLLFMFAFDEGFQGGEQTIESVIANQAKEIQTTSDRIESGSKMLAQAPVRIAADKELSRLKRENVALGEKTVLLTQGVENANAEIAKRVEDFEGYKDQYRALVRGKAKGQEIAKLETLAGAVYTNVNIREVTAVGIQIRHDDGQKRISFEDLPDDMKDYFQFDPKQKEKALADENSTRDEHEAAVAVASEIADQEMAKQREMDKAEAKEKLIREIANKDAQIASVRDEIRGLENDLDRAAAEANAARMAKRMHINKSGSIRARIQTKQNRISALQSEVGMMRSRL